mmetsp:Transcript_12803/g.15672  ORF Transcript_12803/g.15672 Transcript_12803/m.15672 type:complete len:1060 (+) Transcript_12803:80-3259(+)
MPSPDVIIIDEATPSRPQDEDEEVEDVEEPEDVDDEELTFVASAEFQLVGIRYYTGTAHPGEFVTLVREPENPYDRNAIKVNNMHGEKVGHINKASAAKLSPLLARHSSSNNNNNGNGGNMAGQIQIRVDGIIPRRGSAYALPLKVDFYNVYANSDSATVAGSNSALENATALADILKNEFRYHSTFSLAPTFSPASSSSSASAEMSSSSQTTTPKIEVKTMNWQQQAKELDEMFDKQFENQLRNLPDLNMPVQFKNLTLFPHQIEGIKWLVQQENKALYSHSNKEEESNHPFYKRVVEQGRQKWLCEITQCSQLEAPQPIMGSILADEMGLGKTLQTLGLILLSPPTGRVYSTGIDDAKIATTDTASSTPLKDLKDTTNTHETEQEEPPPTPLPSTDRIKSQKVSILKSILKAANLKQSGKKDDLIDRIVTGVKMDVIKGVHFPTDMTVVVQPPPTPAKVSPYSNLPPSSMMKSSGVCTLIVCPVSVMSNWQQQLLDHVRDDVLRLELYHGPNRTDLLPLLQNGVIDVLLVSYHTLAAEFGNKHGKSSKSNQNSDVLSQGSAKEPEQKKRRKVSIFDIAFHRIILDEAHTIRNEKTKYFKAVKEVKADRKLALTGTPFVNKSDDIYSLFSFLGVHPLGDKDIFRRSISQPLKEGNDIGLTRLRTAVSYVALRRSKAKTEIQLVEKEVQLRSISFPENDVHKQTYDALFGSCRLAIQAVLQNDGGDSDETGFKNYSSLFEKLLRMRQSCCSAALVPEYRRKIALTMWKDLQKNDTGKKLSKEEGLKLLEKLKGTFTQAENELPECAVCLMEMEEQDSRILRKCGHVFCNICIEQVLKVSNQKCPMCREPFTKGDMINKSVAVKATLPSSGSDIVSDDSNTDLRTPPKVLALLEAIKTMKSDEKAVIFSQFTSFLDVIGGALKDSGHSYCRIDGSMTVVKRIESISAFSADDGPRLILCSLHAAGTGINLTRGNHAFMMDCWWNDSVENQAMDRIHRIGQTRKVTVVRFVMQDSVEERMVALQEAKSMQAKGAMEKLSAEEKRKARLDQLRGLLLLAEED